MSAPVRCRAQALQNGDLIHAGRIRSLRHVTFQEQPCVQFQAGTTKLLLGANVILQLVPAAIQPQNSHLQRRSRKAWQNNR